MQTLGDIARKGARIHAGREAVVFEGTRLTYRELDRRVNRLAKKIEFWDALPKSAVGKLLRRDVKAKFWEGRDRRIG